MWYIVAFNSVSAVIFAVLALRRRRISGFSFVLLSVLLQLSAVALYWSEWHALEGKPDRLYVWIVPSLLFTMSVPASIAAIVWNSLASARPVESTTHE